MGYIDIGLNKYQINPFNDTVFKMNKSLFKGIRQDIIEDILDDFADILERAEKLSEDKTIPEVFHEKEIKQDIVDGEDHHDRTTQKFYLRGNRRYWEDRYTIEEMRWMVDFQYFISEMEGRVGDEWFRLYEIIRGFLPASFPESISFSVMINNVCDRKINKYINWTVKKYLIDNPKAIEHLRKWEIPEGLILDPDIGLTIEEYVRQAEKFQTSSLSQMEL